MNLKELFEMQKKLDEHIVEEKELEGQDLLAKKILALQVELGELANEWRGFKFWSNNQTSRNNKKCGNCHGRGVGYFSGKEWTGKLETCIACDGAGVSKKNNPLLEEYVDCLHFILSMGIEIFGEYVDKYYSINIFLKAKSKLKQFQLVLSMAQGMYADDFYRELLQSFLGLGEMLGFTEEQIVQAYKDKNQVNHERQENGY